MAGDAEQRKKMMIGIVAVVAILGAGVGLGYYYDLFGSKGSQAPAQPALSSLPPEIQDAAKKQEEAQAAQKKNAKRPPAGS